MKIVEKCVKIYIFTYSNISRLISENSRFAEVCGSLKRVRGTSSIKEN